MGEIDAWGRGELKPKPIKDDNSSPTIMLDFREGDIEVPGTSFGEAIKCQGHTFWWDRKKWMPREFDQFGRPITDEVMTEKISQEVIRQKNSSRKVDKI